MTSTRLIRSLVVLSLALGSSAVLAQEADPAKTPVPVQLPATQPTAKVSPEAQALLDQVGRAYSKLKTLELAGTMRGRFDAAGQTFSESSNFTASYEAPNKFRHASENDILVGSTGEKAYAYLKARNVHTSADAPKEKVASEDLPRPLPMVLAMQDPSLLLAVAKEPGVELVNDSTEISKLEDTKIGEVSYPTLKFALKDETVRTLLIDPQSYLIRQAVSDVSSVLKARNVPDVKSATVTIDYSTLTPDAKIPGDRFAWAPPEGSKDFAKVAVANGGADDAAATQLEGKAAFAFKLKGMDGKQVSLAELKGQVVVIDFWATWCGPCKASLPHLQELYEAKKDKGVSFFALDVKEEKDVIQKFVTETKLTVPVLLDEDGAVSEKYFVEGIPQTVVIGKDGKVAKVFIGFGPNSPEELAKAIAAAQK